MAQDRREGESHTEGARKTSFLNRPDRAHDIEDTFMKLCLGILLLLLTSPALAGDAAMRKFIGKGMTESEVMAKIGPPDYESETSGGGAEIVEKAWTYFPTEGDRDMLTRIVIKGGRVQSVERSISRQ